jgi:hypothetical protein
MRCRGCGLRLRVRRGWLRRGLMHPFGGVPRRWHRRCYARATS